MLTGYDRITRRAGGFFAAVCAAVMFCAGQATNLHAQGVPPNDDLTNATAIVGSSGAIYGTNINATGEVGEPSPFSTNHASIWFLWTAPFTTTMQFNTRGSVIPFGPDAGNQLDTVLAVYSNTAPAGSNITFANLSVLATNDDDPSGGVVSRVDVPVVVGHIYLIQVDGSTNTLADGQATGSNATGWVELNWQPSLVAGGFGFSASTYLASYLDDILPVDFGGNPVAPSLANKSGTNNVRITISRTGGNVGRCEVTLIVTNSYYGNFFETNYSGTNIFLTNYDVNNNVLSWTNIYYTNIATQDFFENSIGSLEEGDPFVASEYFPVLADITVRQTNYDINGSIVINRPVTNIVPLAGLGLTNFFTNFPCFNQFIIPAPVTNTSSTATNITVVSTQLFCSTVILPATTPAAVNSNDYIALVTNLIFNDFQMSQDFYLQVNPSNLFINRYGGYGPTGPDWPDANGNFSFFGANALVSLTLSNVVLDSNEDPDIVPPQLASSSNATLEILNFNGNPANFEGSPSYFNTNTGPGQFLTINLERATFRVNKPNTAYLYVLLSDNPPANSSYVMHYTIDCAGLSPLFAGTPNNAFDWNGFITMADSDYAQPGPVPGDPSRGKSPGQDFEVPLNLPPDPSGYNVGKNTVWPAERFYIGSFTIGPFPGNAPIGEIAIPIDNNGAVEFDMDMLVNLFATVNDATANASQTIPGILGNIASANLSINFSGTEPGGANDVSFDPDVTAGSYQPENPVPGANGGPVMSIAVQPNGQSIIGGYFSSYNTTNVYGVVRLTTNGYIDPTFNSAGLSFPGVNYNGYVNAVVIDSQGGIIIGGNFASYDGNSAQNIARLTSSGAFDPTFATGVGFSNGIVNALCIDTNGNILVAGDFSTYNTTNCNGIARLTPTGGLDTNFLPNTGNGTGANGEVMTVATDGNGNVILGGDFTSMNGVNLNYLARLLPSGAVDPSFSPEIGPDDDIESVAITTGNEIVIGGDFQNYNLVSRPGIALVSVNGSLDTSFVPGTGADGPIYSVILQPNGDIVAAGQFRNFNGNRRLGVVRLLPNGWVDTAFMDTAYNQFAGLINTYFNQSIDPVHICYTLALQPDGNIMVGGSFTNVGGGAARNEIHSKINVARLIGLSNPGPQTGGGGAGNCPGNITLTENPYTIDDTAGKLFVTLNRANGSLGAAQMTLGTNTLPPGPGDATAADYGLILPAEPLYGEIYFIQNNVLYLPTGTYAWRECDGYWGFNNAIQPTSDKGNSALNINIFDDKTALKNLYAGLSELNLNAQDQLILGGVSIPMYPAYGLPSTELEIVNDNVVPGVIGFSASNYLALNTSNSVTVTVQRTNGTANGITVQYGTANGTAISNFYYTGQFPNSKATLTFPGGTGSAVNTATFSVPILPQNQVADTKFFKLYLTNFNPEGVFDTNIPPVLATTSTVTIVDGNFTNGHLSFTSSNFSVLKGGIATVSVQRLGGALGQLTVQCGTANGTAVNGLNYTGVTNTLEWSNQDTSVKTMQIQTLQDNTVDGPLTVNLNLLDPMVVGGLPGSNMYILNTPSNAVLTINDVDSYGQLNFAAQNFNVSQKAGQVLITVTRSLGDTGAISVDYTTLADTNPPPGEQMAVAGTNYGATNGQLVFGSGQTSQSFVVQVYNTSTGETNAANRVLYLELFNGLPSGLTNQNQFPILATLTIQDPNLIVNTAGSIDLTTENGTGFNDNVNALALQPDGSILAGGDFTFFNRYPFDYLARLEPSGDFDDLFLQNQAGPNGTVFQVISEVTNAYQTNNGSITIAGGFSQVDNTTRSGVARLDVFGGIDETFNPGSGADNTVYALAETFLPGSSTNFTLAYYIGGAFANFDGEPNAGIARLNASTNSPGPPGTLDPNFMVGLGATGVNPIVRALAVQADGKVVLGGDFTSFNNLSYNHIIRLNADGSIDTNFASGPGTGTSDSVRAIAIQADGQIIIGGLFTNVAGSNMNYLARLNGADGSLDTNFNIGTNGGNNAVLALALDDEQRILVGGQFSEFSGVTRSGITRLNSDGSVDPTINFQSGADGGYVSTITIQTNDEIDLGGGFSTFEGQSENNFVRVYGGSTAGEGTIQFTAPSYTVLENATNAIITLQRLGGEGTPGAEANVSVVFSTQDGLPPDGATNGIDYTAVTTNVVFPFGETYVSISIPILDSNVVAGNKTLNLTLSDPTYATIGNLASATLTIINVNSYVSYAQPVYNQSADAPGGSAIIPITRYGYTSNTVSVTAYTGTNGTATPYTNYMPETNVITFNPGVVTTNFLVPVFNATNMFSDQTVDLELSNGVNTLIAGSNTSATLYIDNVYNGPGVLAFSQSNYSILAPTSLPATNAYISIVRTNGSSNSVWVTLSTSNGTATAGPSSNGVALNGTNYLSVTTTVYFAEGETNEVVPIPIYAQPDAGPATTVYLNLSNPGNGATIGSPGPQVVLTILNAVENIAFTNSPYFVSESAGTLYVGAVRNGDTNLVASANYATVTPTNTTEAEGWAQPGVDYVPTNGTITFQPGVTFQEVPIGILQTNMVNLEPLTFYVDLSSNLSSGDQIEMPGGQATVEILCDVTGFDFATNSDGYSTNLNSYFVGENGSNIVVTVNRINPDTGDASVQFATSDNTALSNVDYIGTNGTLFFPNGTVTNTFTVEILNPDIVENNKSFNVTLSNPQVLTLPNPSTNAYLLSPSNVAVTITNVLAGVSFASPTYAVSECSNAASIAVILSGVTNIPVSVFFTTTNGGSGIAGTNYFATNGTLTFEPGQTVQTFEVTPINDGVIGPDHTVYLALANPSGAQLLNPSTAVLTIQECNGHYIVKSGTAFVSGNMSPPGDILPGETVTIDFGLRAVAGGDTTNLIATLLTTNGITNPSGPQTYGVLITNGPTVYRPFTFTAQGTNGQTIVANFSLADGSNTNVNPVAFGFTLGGGIVTIGTNEALNLYGSNEPPSKAYNNNPPNYGYPSVINVSGAIGNMTSLSVTLSNLSHSFQSDVSALLEFQPSGGSNLDTVLFSDCGGEGSVNNLNLTFATGAGNSLPQSSTMTSGTYAPTAFDSLYATLFPATLQGQPQTPLSPYPLSMAPFVGQTPNGTWLLFLADEGQFDSGVLADGWTLSIGTGISVEEDADLEMGMTVSTGDATMQVPITYTITVTNFGPAGATNVTVVDLLPPGVTYGTNVVGVNGLTVTNNLGNLAVGSVGTLNITVTPNLSGQAYYITNVAIATANQPDLNLNYEQTNILLVESPSADLGVALSSGPATVTDSNNVVYTNVILNNGPSTAMGILATNVLPADFVPITITPLPESITPFTNANGTVTVTVIWDVGTLSHAASATLLLTAEAELPTTNSFPVLTNTDMFSAGSLVYDPTKTNNFAFANTVVNPPPPAPLLSYSSGGDGSTYTLSWPAGQGFVLKAAVTLGSPWVTIPNAPDPYVLTATNIYHYFIVSPP